MVVAQPRADEIATDGSLKLLQPIRINAIRIARSESMVVCVCNAIREKDLRAAVRCGSEKPNDVYARMGRKPKCGQCLSFARDIISGTAATA
jgi:bacterioferritin-associated ferredoxin